MVAIEYVLIDSHLFNFRPPSLRIDNYGEKLAELRRPQYIGSATLTRTTTTAQAVGR